MKLHSGKEKGFVRNASDEPSNNYDLQPSSKHTESEETTNEESSFKLYINVSLDSAMST